MFVGDTGINRVIRRTLEVMKELGSDDPDAVRRAGAIDLPTIQRYVNFWFSSALDLFGSEVSSNAASYFANGIKGRPDEARYEDHLASGERLAVEMPDGKGGVAVEEVPLRNAMNEVVRGAYVKDCEIGVVRWNRVVSKAGVEFQIKLPSPRFRRSIGAWAGRFVDPAGRPVDEAAWHARRDEWLPTDADRIFVKSLMQRVGEPGKMAAWIAPPDRGVNNLPVSYEYVRLH